MSNDTRANTHVVGTLRSVDGVGVVRMEDRYDTAIDDLAAHLAGQERADWRTRWTELTPSYRRQADGLA